MNCPDCKESVNPIVIQQDLRIIRQSHRRYTVQYECPDCAYRWWGHVWKKREAAVLT